MSDERDEDSFEYPFNDLMGESGEPESLTVREAKELAVELRNIQGPIWAGVFNGCLANGFTREESLELLKTWIMAQEMHC